MSATTTRKPTAKATKGTHKRQCPTCSRKLFRVWDRAAQAAEYVCLDCTVFVPTDMNRK